MIERPIEPVVEILRRRARDDRDRPWCHFQDRAITFGELGARVNQVANALAGAGLAAGDRVAVMLSNHPDHAWTILALYTLGVTQVPINVHTKATGLRYLIEHSEARAVIAEADYAGELLPALAGENAVDLVVWRGKEPAVDRRRALRFEELVAAGSTGAPRPVIDPEQVLSIMYTSGTTGPPKGVMLTDRMFVVGARAAGLAADVRRGDTLFFWEPLYHIGGLAAMLATVDAGVGMALVERFSASQCWDQIRRYGATQLHYLGGVLNLLLRQPPRPDDADNPVRVVWGAAAPARSWEEIERRFGVKIREGYGMTEASNFTMVNLEGRVGSIGRPLPYFEVRIVGEDGRPLGPRQVGEIAMREREPGLLMKGYFKDPDRTRAALGEGGWFYSGDLGHYDEDGFFYFSGRKKDSLRRRGENVSAWEVERVVNTHPAVEECAVVGVPSEMGEDDIKIFVKPAPGESLEPLELIRWCERHLAYFQVPRYVALVDEFPRGPSQRIRKEGLSRSVVDCWDLETSGYRIRRARRGDGREDPR